MPKAVVQGSCVSEGVAHQIVSGMLSAVKFFDSSAGDVAPGGDVAKKKSKKKKGREKDKRHKREKGEKGSHQDERGSSKHKRKPKKRRHGSDSEDASEDDLSDEDSDEGSPSERRKRGKKTDSGRIKKRKSKGAWKADTESEESDNDDSSQDNSNDKERQAEGGSAADVAAASAARSAAGLDWMLKAPAGDALGGAAAGGRQVQAEGKSAEDEANERMRARELNPELRHPPGAPGEPGAPGHATNTGAVGGPRSRPAPAAVGDGGASWRLKAMKRAKEQAERDGKDWKKSAGGGGAVGFGG